MRSSARTAFTLAQGQRNEAAVPVWISPRDSFCARIVDPGPPQLSRFSSSSSSSPHLLRPSVGSACHGGVLGCVSSRPLRAPYLPHPSAIFASRSPSILSPLDLGGILVLRSSIADLTWIFRSPLVPSHMDHLSQPFGPPTPSGSLPARGMYMYSSSHLH